MFMQILHDILSCLRAKAGISNPKSMFLAK